MDRNGSGRSRPFQLSKRTSRLFEMADVGSLLVVLELDDIFDLINDIVRAEFTSLNFNGLF